MKGYTDVTAFTTAILEEVGLALITGAGFEYQRMSVSAMRTDLDTLKEAIRRLHQFMELGSKPLPHWREVLLLNLMNFSIKLAMKWRHENGLLSAFARSHRCMTHKQLQIPD